MAHPFSVIAAIGLLSPLLACTPQQSVREPVIGPCEGCEAVFDGMAPIESVPPSARIAPEDEPGTPMVVRGTVRNQRGEPAPGIVVYAYQTDSDGAYPVDPSLRRRPGERHGRLRGWVRTDARGHYEFLTIRPGAYPDSSEPEHIHMHILEPGLGTYYIDDVMFTDDPLLARQTRRQPQRGGPGVVTPRRDDEGRWVVTRDITLGLNVADYPGR